MYNQLPFPFGTTLGVTDAVAGSYMTGQEFAFRDVNVGGSTTLRGTGRTVWVRAVANTSGGTLAIGSVVGFDTTGTATPQLAAANEPCKPMDYALTAAVPAGDVYYVIVEGPAKAKTKASSPGTGALGEHVISAGSGRIIAFDATDVASIKTSLKGTVGSCQETWGTGDTSATRNIEVFR